MNGKQYKVTLGGGEGEGEEMGNDVLSGYTETEEMGNGVLSGYRGGVNGKWCTAGYGKEMGNGAQLGYRGD